MTARLVFGERELSPAEIEQRASRAASGLEEAGIREGDTVAIMLGNEPAYLDLMLGCRQLGAFHCPINWHFKADEAGFILRDSGAKLLAGRPDLLAEIRAGIPAGLPVIEDWEGWLAEQSAWTGKPRTPRGNMPYTSGTTGRPKGVRRVPATPQQRSLAMDLYRVVLGIEPGMRAFLSAPLYHSAPNLYALQCIQAAELLVLEERFDAERTLQLIERHRITNLYLVPTMYVRMLRLPPEVRKRYDLSSVKFVSSTGSPCAPDVKRAMIDWWGPVVTETYASSETGHITFVDSKDWLAHPGTAGRVLGEGTLKIIGDDGRELPPGEVGLIYVRQPAYPDFAYSNDAKARAAIERDGLWAVGDMGYVDAEGWLYVADRKSDMVISGGVNIYPAEIEAVLVGMPGIADCAVFGIPDAEFGEALAAAVQPRQGASIDSNSVIEFLRAKIANYKVPRVVTFHDALPREDSGKIFKRKLRAPYWENAGRNI